MAILDGPKEPSRPTMKRLFALSGNLCAFPKCSTPLVDPQSRSIVGEICHIKGEKSGASRYDAGQTNEQRHGFDNLILLCNVHHKIIDDDDTTYTIERLIQMKQEHESRHTGPSLVNEATSDRFITVAISNSTVQGSVIASHGQTGGQTAHIIHNFYGSGHTHVFCVATHIGTHESVDTTRYEWYGRPVAPQWLRDTPDRMSSHWLVERLTADDELQLYFAPKWGGGTYFVVDVDRGDGEVINLDQLADLRPSSPTTTTTPAPSYPHTTESP
jgi:hypothetical protein